MAVIGRVHYTDVVEHFFRMAVRHETVYLGTSFDWFGFTKDWISKLPGEQREIIEYVFSDMYLRTMDGLYACKRNVPMYEKRAILAEIERQFALDSGLI